MTYSPAVAAALSGASVRQLSYWRSAQSVEGPLLAPGFHRPRARVSYSFQDVLALRTFVYLRSQNVPLQRIRRSVRSLRTLGETEHLAAYRLVAVGREVVWRTADDAAVDLSRQPGQEVIAGMVDVLGRFDVAGGREVLPLLRPKPGIAVDPGVRGGYPVIEGTRVPYDLVATLLADGIQPADIASFYPSVGPEAAEGARAFERYVDGYRHATAA